MTGDHHKWVDIRCGTSPRCEALEDQSIMLAVSLPKKHNQGEISGRLGVCLADRIEALYS